MANIIPTVTYNPDGQRQCVQVVWASMGNADNGLPVNLPGYNDASIQVEGTPASATLALKGTNEATPTNYEPMPDQGGTAISFTAVGFKMFKAATRWVAPFTTGGAGTALTVTMMFKRAT